jgi:predicted AlkP superfamily pyrophosphatase or phosphodiesterase
MAKLFLFYFLVLAFSSVINARNPTLMISLDGFRADKLDEFLSKNPQSTFQKEFVNVGAKAAYMTPAFPSLTFPNHFTIITGKN